MYHISQFLSLGGTVTITNATVHGANAAYALLDRVFTALPVRLLHVWHTMVYGVIYAIMTGIHFAAGGDPIYPMLDYYDAPGMAVAFLVGLIIVAAPLGHFLGYAVTLAREAMRARCSCCNRTAVEAQKEHNGIDNRGAELEQPGEKTPVCNDDVEPGRDNPAMQLDSEQPAGKKLAVSNDDVELGGDNPALQLDSDDPNKLVVSL